MLQTIFNCSDGEKQILNINVVVAWSYTLKWQKEIVDHGDHWQVYSSSGREIDNRYPAFVYICSYKGFNHRYPSFSMHAQSSMGFFLLPQYLIVGSPLCHQVHDVHVSACRYNLALPLSNQQSRLMFCFTVKPIINRNALGEKFCFGIDRVLDYTV